MEHPPCQLVNPLCPDDLCRLPDGHRGRHLLSTMGERMPVSRVLFRAPPIDGRLRTPDELVDLGFARQRELFPD